MFVVSLERQTTEQRAASHFHTTYKLPPQITYMQSTNHFCFLNYSTRKLCIKTAENLSRFFLLEDETEERFYDMLSSILMKYIHIKKNLRKFVFLNYDTIYIYIYIELYWLMSMCHHRLFQTYSINTNKQYVFGNGHSTFNKKFLRSLIKRRGTFSKLVNTTLILFL